MATAWNLDLDMVRINTGFPDEEPPPEPPPETSDLFTEVFDTGTTGAAVPSGGSAFFSGVGVTGTVTYRDTAPLSPQGGKYCRFSGAAGGAASRYRMLDTAVTSMATGFFGRFTTVPPGNVVLVQARGGGTPPNTPGTTILGGIRFNPVAGSGCTVSLRNGSTVNGDPSTRVLPTGGWWRLEWKFTGAGTSSGTQELRIFLGSNVNGDTPDEVMTRDFTITTAPSGVDNLIYGIGAAVTTAWDVDVDAVRVNTEFPGRWTGPLGSAPLTWGPPVEVRRADPGDLFSENFDSGTAGVTVPHGGTAFFSGLGTGANTLTTYSGATPLSPQGGLFARFAAGDGQAVSRYRTFSAAASTMATTFYGRFTALPPGNVVLVQARGGGSPPTTAGTTILGGIRLNPATGGCTVSLRNGSSVNGDPSGTVLPTGGWWRLEWKYTGGGTSSGTQELRIFVGANVNGTEPDEVMSRDFTITTAPSGADNFIYGIGAAVSTAWAVDLDHIRVAEEFTGPVGGAPQSISAYRVLDAAATTIATGWYGRFDTAPPQPVFCCVAGGGGAPPDAAGLTIRAGVRINTNRTLSIINGTPAGGTVVATSAAALPTGAWWRADWKVSNATGVQTQDLRIFTGSTVGTNEGFELISGAFTTGTVDSFTYGLVTTGETWTYDVDGVQIASSFPGPWTEASGSVATTATDPLSGDSVTVNVAVTADPALTYTLALTRDDGDGPMPVALDDNRNYTYTA
jgi:hypothetical protein